MTFRPARVLAALVSMICIVVAGASVASAAIPVTPDSTWGTNGKVDAVLRVGNTIYLGGTFTGLQDPASSATTTVSNLAGIDATTGQPTSFAPAVNGEVFALAQSPDGSTLYAAGNFTTVGGKTHKRIAAFNTSTGALLAWKPYAWPNNVVRALAVTSDHLYIGGAFTTPTTRIAALNPATGAAIPGFTASADNLVRDFALTGNRLYVAGNFNTVNGTSQGKLTALNPTTGASIAGVYHPSYPVLDLAAGGSLFAAGGGGGGKALAVNLATGAKIWEIKTDGNVQAVDVLNGTPYFGGHFLKYGSTVVSQLVRANPGTGALDTTWLPQVTSGFLGVFGIDAFGTNKIYVGGDFTRVNDLPRFNFAQFTDSGAVTSADLSVGLTGSPSSVSTGQSVTYTAQVGNAGPDPAQTTTLTDALPAGLDFVSAPSGCTYDSTARTVTCALGTVTTAGTSVAITLAPNTPGSIVNTVSVSSATADPSTANNSASATTAVASGGGADLGVTTAVAAKVNEGASFSYVFTVANHGPADEPAAQFSDNLPLTATSVTTDTGTCTGTTAVSCSIGLLKSGTSATITIKVTAPATPQTVGNTATVSGSAVDTVSANNSSASSVTVVDPGTGDKTPPALTGMVMSDQNHDGFVDTVTVTFNEALAACTAPCTQGWTLTDVPGGGVLQSVTVSGSVATLHLGAWTDQPDTAVNLFKIALAAGNGIQDAAGNHSSFAASAPMDGAGPVPVGFRHQHNSKGACAGLPNTAGLVEQCDQLTSEWSEPLLASSIPATTNFTITDPGAGANDTVTIPSFQSGSLDLGSAGYVTLDGSTAAWPGSTLTLATAGDALTVQVFGACTGTGCASLAVVKNVSVTYVPAATITDLAGNPAAGSFAKTQTMF